MRRLKSLQAGLADWHTLASVPNDVKFAGLMASLRAPRVAVIVPTNGWELHAR